MQHKPRKHFGQNFLISQPIINNILHALHLSRTDHVLEIGPGLGALTLPLLQILDTLTAIEIDKDLYAYLIQKNIHTLKIFNIDALNFAYATLTPNTRIIGNLPYNISTPLLLCLLKHCNLIKDMHFMLQKEVAYRLAAEPGNKNYGKLSVIVQYQCLVELLFNVDAQAFKPIPKVDSSFIRLTPYVQSPYPKVPLNLLEKVVTQAFSTRRKTLSNSLKPLFDQQTLSKHGINPQARAEQLSIMDYVRLSQTL